MAAGREQTVLPEQCLYVAFLAAHNPGVELMTKSNLPLVVAF